jgi:hypothetical protein
MLIVGNYSRLDGGGTIFVDNKTNRRERALDQQVTKKIPAIVIPDHPNQHRLSPKGLNVVCNVRSAS